ncbi:hypothetical protein QBC34DRAFT_433427 [Podospora aff. communis PSN243]|uniref:Uncharacterized protein n=1 Tax=Podospora aff. communis PSN243 TaxID=3040156 RepID=A0AAV9H3G3_9PEZI|nr:hypothetical protein QBC34DRAFT_433427 [Podospora aff. communis PSN243]
MESLELPEMSSSGDGSKGISAPVDGLDTLLGLLPAAKAVRDIQAQPARNPLSWASISIFLVDLTLAIPAILFLVYAAMVARADGKDASTEPVLSLINAATYGPSIFPIVFAAVTANFLRALAAWKLERGITVLNLELLLGSRSVFSAFSIPFSIRSINLFVPLLMVLWALSPLGGQAALRAVEVAPPETAEPWIVQYLDFMSEFPYSSPTSSAGIDLLPAALGAFSAALAAPPEVKGASQDAFRNIKIPMIEPCQRADTPKDQDGWFGLEERGNISFSSLSGLPIASLEPMITRANYSFVLETSYVYANCSVSHSTGMSMTEFRSYLDANTRYNNWRTLVITPLFEPQVIFTSWTINGLTNATCNLTTTFVEAEVRCRGSVCENIRARPGKIPEKPLYPKTVLSGLPAEAFFRSFVNASETPWSKEYIADPYSTPIEYYFTHPEAPYSARRNASEDGWRGAEIWPVGDEVFSQRFTELLNTFWIVNIAPFAVTGNFTYESQPRDPTPGPTRYRIHNVTGSVISNDPVLRASWGWIAMLIVASSVILLAGVLAAALRLLRRGPDILDRTPLLLRDNPYADVQPVSSMEGSVDAMARLKDVKVCIGDGKTEAATGRLVFGTVGEVEPLARQRKGRLYS